MKDEGDRLVDLTTRTRRFALRIIRMYSALPKSSVAQTIGRQVLRSGTSIGAHYREGMRSRSNAEFISKLQVGLQELEETLYWMELLVESHVVSSSRMDDLMREADELIAILTTCAKNVKKRSAKHRMKEKA